MSEETKKDTTAALHAEILRLHTVLDNVGALVFIKDLEGRFTFANKSMCDMYGKQVEEVVGKKASDFLDAESAGAVRRVDERVVRTGKPYTYEESIVVVSSGETRTLLTSKTPIHDENGNINGICGIATNISERKALELELYSQLVLQEVILNNLDARVFIKTNDRRFLYVNDAAADIVGLPREQIIGRLDTELMSQEYADTLWEKDRQVFELGRKLSAEGDFTDARGEKRHYWTVRVPVQLPGHPPALIGFATDVTALHDETVARKAAEKGLMARNHYLSLNNAVLDKLGQNASLSDTLDTMVRIIDDYRPGVRSTVLLVADNGKELVFCAPPNLTGEWRSTVPPILIGDDSGPSAAAASLGETVIVEDLASHPAWGELGKVSAQFGLCAAWAQPIKSSDGKVLGVFTMYQPEPSVPDADDFILLDEYAKLAQLVIERSRLSEALKESQYLYRLMAENINDMIWVMEYPFLKCSYVSPSAQRLRGWPAEEILEQQLEEMVSPSAVSLVQETLQECMRRIDEGDMTGRFFTLELDNLHKAGHLVPMEIKGTIMLDSESRPTHIIGSSRDITERKAAEDAIRKLAFLDPLTGLPNRRLMEDRLGNLIALAKREQRKLALLFLDLDKFKEANDQHGHEAGDWLLLQIAGRMGVALRDSDTVARVGGDEFVILLPDVRNADEAMLVAEKVRVALEQPFVMDNGVSLAVSSSIGVVIYPDQADNSRDLLRYGDEAMYRAKKGGRNAVVAFTAPEPHEGEDGAV